VIMASMQRRTQVLAPKYAQATQGTDDEEEEEEDDVDSDDDVDDDEDEENATELPNKKHAPRVATNRAFHALSKGKTRTITAPPPPPANHGETRDEVPTPSATTHGEALARLRDDYGVVLSKEVAQEGIECRTVHIELSKDNKTFQLPLYKVSNHTLVKIVCLGCQEWSLPNTNQSVGLKFPSFPETIQMGGNMYTMTLAGCGSSVRPKLLYVCSQDDEVRSQLPNLKPNDCDVGAQPARGKNNQISEWWLPTDIKDGAPVCPLGYLTRASYDHFQEPYTLQPFGEFHCLVVSDMAYQKMLLKLQAKVRDSSVIVDLLSYRFEIVPRDTGSFYYGTVILDIFYTPA
jgi:hypothetical protein